MNFIEDMEEKLIENNMEQYVIPDHLRDVEEEYDVKILLAVESGSRAWGFESKNSDWDVRFIYVHKPEWYFKVEEQRDVIERMYADEVDLVGWELRKALSLLKRSNPSLLEWLNSPKVYYMDEDFANRIREVEKVYFNPIKCMYHYNHIYKKHNERYLQQEGFPIKRFLYYLHGVLACKWIETYLTLPPVAFKELVNATVDNKEIRSKIDELIESKKSGKESDIIFADKSVVEYAHKIDEYYNGTINSFRPGHTDMVADSLDKILYDMVLSKA